MDVTLDELTRAIGGAKLRERTRCVKLIQAAIDTAYGNGNSALADALTIVQGEIEGEATAGPPRLVETPDIPEEPPVVDGDAEPPAQPTARPIEYVAPPPLFTDEFEEAAFLQRTRGQVTKQWGGVRD